jgi:hypothetical protein
MVQFEVGDISEYISYCIGRGEYKGHMNYSEGVVSSATGVVTSEKRTHLAIHGRSDVGCLGFLISMLYVGRRWCTPIIIISSRLVRIFRLILRYFSHFTFWPRCCGSAQASRGAASKAVIGR